MAREVSRTKFEHLDAAQAARVASQAFPAFVDEPAGGPPDLGGGQRVVGYLADNVARVELPGGQHGAIVSSQPMAVQVTGGRRVPIDLSLRGEGAAFVPGVAPVGVRIPRRLAEGISLLGAGVSLTPVSATGYPLGAEGAVDGMAVDYANTQTDEDTLAKPTAFGFELDSLLRSVNSPGQLFFRLGAPAGAKIIPHALGVEVLLAGKVVAVVQPPVAVDAEGTSVPVTMSVRGHTLVLRVDDRGGQYRYPINVDPIVGDTQWISEGTHTNWAFKAVPEHYFYGSGALIGAAYVEYPYAKPDRAYWAYRTQGESHIYAFGTNFYLSEEEDLEHETLPPPVSAALSIANPRSKTTEAEVILTEDGDYTFGEDVGLCVDECKFAVTKENEGNEAFFEVNALNTTPVYIPFQIALTDWSVAISQEAEPTVHFDTSEATIGGKPNAAYSGWVNDASGTSDVLGINAYDPGTGIHAVGASSPSKTGWGFAPKENAQNGCAGVQCNECYESECPAAKEGEGAQHGSPLALPFSELGELPEGEDTIEATVKDAVGLSATAKGTVKIDNAPPHSISLSGLPSSGEIIEQPYHLTAEATDGSGGVKSSGVKELRLAVDGSEVGRSSGSCSPGPCTAKGEWTIDGNEFGAGGHTLTVTAIDNAGNTAKETYAFKDHHGSLTALGPGQVNLASGEFSLGATDVSVPAPGASLTVQREYRSRHLTAGSSTGPLGPEWTLSVSGEESLAVLPDGNATLTGASGAQSTFKTLGEGKFESPKGDATLTLKSETGGTEYVLRNPSKDTTTRFTLSPGGSVWRPTKQEGPLASQTVRYFYQTVDGVTEPKYALAPEPTGLSFSCAAKLEKSEKLESGCRALEFRYAAATKAKGEGESEWGEYIGRLSEVLLRAYNPESKAMGETAMAEYKYDSQGRLRQEWNPQISPALYTTYGYNSENEVTAVTPPGQQPWLFHYGTLAGEATTGAPGGYLLAVIRSAASATRVGTSIAPENEGVPTLSSKSPAVGQKISVSSNGTWTHSPPAFSYQWEDCNASGKECTPIAGAVNESYYPVKSDEGHTLVAQVTAMNKSGATVAMSVATSAVASGTEDTPLPESPDVGSNAVWTVEYEVPLEGHELNDLKENEIDHWGQTDAPVEGTALFPPDEPMGWPAKEYRRATVDYFDSKGRVVNVASPTGGVSTTEYNTYNDVSRTLSPDGRAAALAGSGCENKEHCADAELARKLDTEYTYEESGSEPGARLLSTLGPAHVVKLANGPSHADEEKEMRAHTRYFYDEGAPEVGGPYNLVTKRIEGAREVSGEGEFDRRTTATSYSGQNDLGWTVRTPTSVTIDPTGLDLVHTTEYEEGTGQVRETRMPAVGNTEYAYSAQVGAKGSEPGQVGHETTMAVDHNGNLWVADSEHYRVEEFNGSGEYVKEFGSKEEGTPWAITAGSKKRIWVLENSTECKIKAYGESGETQVTITAAHGSGSGECSDPSGIAADKHGNVWVADTGNSRLEEFNEKGEYLKTVGTKGAGVGQLEQPTTVAIDSHGDIFAGDYKNERVEEYNEKGEYLREFGSTKELPLGKPLGLAIDPHGDILVMSSNNRVEMFNPEGTYEAKFGQQGSGTGQFEFSDPSGIAVLPNGSIWLTDSLGYRLEKWLAPSNATGNIGAHDTRTIYYTVAANSEFKECGGHPEYANLQCLTIPVSQPGTSGLPPLPETSYSSYNVYDEPLKTVETFGTTTRTNTDTYNAGGRLERSQVSSTAGTNRPPTVYEYSEETGALTTEKASGEGKTLKIAYAYNTLGQLTSYTDASGTTSTYEYDVDGRVSKTNDGKGTQTFTYSTTGGQLAELVDSSAEGMKFTATYDPEGNMLTESYPNGMTASYTYNATGTPIKLEYDKTTHCTEKCTWFSDAIVPSIHGETISQTSTLSKQEYLYDAAGRLVQVQDTPASQGCTTRDYVFDEDTNRTSLTTYEPSASGECSTETGTTETHSYDTGDRLTDSGTKYNELGDIAALPAADAGGSELKSSYYSDGQVQSQTQKEQTIGYNLDPSLRPYETISTGKPVDSTLTSNYAGPGDAPSWTTNLSGETQRNIRGITGELAAIQNGSEAPVLQLTNLHGDIIATASKSETATELSSKQDTGEYGVPTNDLPPKYSWLGALELPTEFPSGILEMGARSYVPQLGRFLQPDPIPGGSANAYGYTFGNPINTFDPSGDYTVMLDAFDEEHTSERSSYRVTQHEAEEARRAAEEAAARQAAEEAAALAAEYAEAAAGPGYAGEEGEWEEWEEEEEGGYEYAAYHQGTGSGNAEAHVEPAILVQPLNNEGTSLFSPVVPLCKAEHEGPCALLTRSRRHRAIETRIPGKTVVPYSCEYEERTRAHLSPAQKRSLARTCSNELGRLANEAPGGPELESERAMRPRGF